jgi:hypothetical protein
MTFQIQVLSLDRNTHVAGLNQVMGYHPSPFDNQIFNDNTYINKR